MKRLLLNLTGELSFSNSSMNRLYATITSDKASKSQGGKDYIIIDLNVGREQVHQIELYYNDDTKNDPTMEQDEWVLKHRYYTGDEESASAWEIIAQGNVFPENKI